MTAQSRRIHLPPPTSVVAQQGQAICYALQLSTVGRQNVSASRSSRLTLLVRSARRRVPCDHAYPGHLTSASAPGSSSLPPACMPHSVAARDLGLVHESASAVVGRPPRSSGRAFDGDPAGTADDAHGARSCRAQTGHAQRLGQRQSGVGVGLEHKGDELIPADARRSVDRARRGASESAPPRSSVNGDAVMVNDANVLQVIECPTWTMFVTDKVLTLPVAEVSASPAS